MHKILQSHLLRAFVVNLKIDTIYALYPESFCDKNLAIWKVFAFCDSACCLGQRSARVLTKIWWLSSFSKTLFVVSQSEINEQLKLIQVQVDPGDDVPGCELQVYITFKWSLDVTFLAFKWNGQVDREHIFA